MLLQGGRRRSAKQQARRRRRRKTCTNQLLLMFARTTCRIRNASRQASRESELATFTCCAYDTPWSDFGKSFFLLMLLTWLLIKHSQTHTQGETLEEPQILTAVEWRQASHLVIESGNLNESAGNAIDMTIVITIDIDNGIGKAIIVVVLARHKPHRHCHYSAAFAITPLLAWMSVCGLRTARSESTSCRLALASEYLNLILTFIMHTQEAHISVPLSISDYLSLSLLSFVTTNYLCDLISFPFCCCCSARHQAARFVSLYFRVWFACGWWKMFAADWLAVGSCRMRINQIKASPLSARENPQKPF